MKPIRGILFAAASLLFSTAFLPADNRPFEDKILEYFSAWKLLAQEKLYLHLDKPYYAAGDNIYFKGYLVDAVTHSPENIPTNYIYVELADRKDSVFVRQKIRRDSAGFRGSLVLSPELNKGDYVVRAYTEWMRNGDPDFFFTKNIRIENSILEKVKAAISYRTDANGSRRAIVRFSAPDGSPVQKAKVHHTVTNKQNKNPRYGNHTTDERGEISFSLPATDTAAVSPRIDLHLTSDLYDSRYTFYLPVFEPDFHLDFFPEGGNLTDGATQIVAFKGQQANGYSIETEGYVTDSRGDTLTRFKSEHDGMGSFALKVRKGETYRATAVSASGQTKTFDLPQASETPYALRLTQAEDRVHYAVTAAPGISETDTVYLAAHVRGDIIFAHAITGGNRSGIIPSSLFKAGIAHFILLDKEGMPLAERLVFFRPEQPGQWKISTDKPVYRKRDKIAVTLRLTDSTGYPLQGNFSVSVTDDRLVQTDSMADNIVSNLLLTSDLKGYIENPAYYFRSDDAITRRHLDLVMLTHGWRRFKIENVSEMPVAAISHYKEGGQTISGRILNPLKTGAKNASVSLTTLDNSTVAQVSADENGYFLIDSIGFRDTTLFLIQGRSRKGSDVVTVEVDPETFPEIPNKNLFKEPDTARLQTYADLVRDIYFNTGGVPVYELNEITVTGKKDESLETNYSSISSYIMSPDRFLRPGINTAFDAVCMLPGVFGTGTGELKIRNQTPLLLIDNMECDDPLILKDIEARHVKAIEVLKGATSSFMTSRNTSGGVIMVTLEAGHIQTAEKSPGFHYFKRLGYHLPKEFYQPTYDTPEKKELAAADQRSTLYWNPSVDTDETGNIRLEFYASDHPENYRITIEGIGDTGSPYRYSDRL